MKIVILIPKLHAGSELALNKLLQKKDLNIVGIVRSDISPLTKKYWRYFRYGLRRAGAFYAIIIALVAYLHFIGLGLASLFIWNRKRRWLHITKLIKKHKLAIHDTSNINSKESIAIIKSWEPDVLVSINFDQILKKRVIKIPKITTLNMHPGLLPKYKGVWPSFWKLHNGEKYAGVTIHHLNEKIDEGAIIAQRKFRIHKNETSFHLALRSAQHGSQLLIKTLQKMKKGIKLPTIKIKAKPSYYSLPSKVEFDAFHAKGKRIFSGLGLWKEFKRRF